MRFSSIFQLPAILPQPAAGEDGGLPPAAAQPAVAAEPAQDLPDDLDARVRLVGEWQLGEG